MTETQIMFKLRQHIAGLEHQMRQLEAMVLAQNNELEVCVAVGCAWAFEMGRKIAEIEDRYAGPRAPTDADTLRDDIFADLNEINPDITEAEKESALRERYAAQDEALKKMQATKTEPKILRP